MLISRHNFQNKDMDMDTDIDNDIGTDTDMNTDTDEKCSYFVDSL